jgi:hypothetical protein
MRRDLEIRLVSPHVPAKRELKAPKITAPNGRKEAVSPHVPAKRELKA